MGNDLMSWMVFGVIVVIFTFGIIAVNFTSYKAEIIEVEGRIQDVRYFQVNHSTRTQIVLDDGRIIVAYGQISDLKIRTSYKLTFRVEYGGTMTLLRWEEA